MGSAAREPRRGRAVRCGGHMPRTPTRPAAAPTPVVDLRAVLESAPLPRTVTKYRAAAVIFSQGDNASDVFYLQDGSIKLSVLSRTGTEAVVAVLGADGFFGERCLAGRNGAWPQLRRWRRALYS